MCLSHNNCYHLICQLINICILFIIALAALIQVASFQSVDSFEPSESNKANDRLYVAYKCDFDDENCNAKWNYP